MSVEYVSVKMLSDTAKFYLPQHKGDIGFDLYADEDMLIKSSMQVCADDECVMLADMKSSDCRKLIKTGISISFTNGYARIAPRSGLSVKGIDVVAGVVDSSYRGELKVCLVNNSEHGCVKIKKGDKIAQLIFEQASVPIIVYSQNLEESTRGAGGFGSTDLLAEPNTDRKIHRQAGRTIVDIETTNV